MLACYTDRLSLDAGERVALNISADRGPCTIELARVGRSREVVLRREGVATKEQPLGERPDRDGCDWSATVEMETEAAWPSGYYDIAVRDSAGEETHHFICLRRADGPRAKAALVLNTNTYHAYNWWGGANAYADVSGLMSGRLKLDAAMANATGILSARRPFVQNLIAPPAGVPRLVNMRKREFGERPWAGGDPAWMRAHAMSPYDNSAGFLQKWEHAFAAWAEAEGIAPDYLTDHDLERADALDGYRCVILAGHSEYWSGPQRDTIEAFVDAGGGLAIFSGNTAFWRVRWEADGARLICHKWRGFEAEPDAGTDGTHLWSHPTFARPEAAITGLSFLYGGYHRLGLCVARGQAGYTIYDDGHWALEGSDLCYGDVIGDAVPLIGYENDGCPIAFDDRNLPVSIPRLGVPEDLRIIAMAPAAFGEDLSRGYRPLIPPEKLDVCASIAYGDASAASQQRVLRGHAVMASFRRGKGEVFNGGTTEWPHGLAAGDPFVGQITRTVLKRFGGV